MAPNEQRDDTNSPHQQDRDVAQEDPSTHGSGTDPEPDHSEREWGGDQDIDTAGMIPGNKATDNDEPGGF